METDVSAYQRPTSHCQCSPVGVIAGIVSSCSFLREAVFWCGVEAPSMPVDLCVLHILLI